MPEPQGDVLTCLACGEKGVGIGFTHDCDPIAARRERARCAAYVYDRAHQYDNSSGIHAALCEVAYELEQGEAKLADEHGDLDDLCGSKQLPPRRDGARNLALAKVWKIITTASHYSISVTGPHLTLTKRLDVLRRALEAAYDAGAKSARSPG